METVHGIVVVFDRTCTVCETGAALPCANWNVRPDWEVIKPSVVGV